MQVFIGASLNERFVKHQLKEYNATLLSYPETIFEYPTMIGRMQSLIIENQNIIIITNSPYIINIVEILIERHGIDCRFMDYIDSVDGIDCTDNLEEVYTIMAKPFQDLENMRYED